MKTCFLSFSTFLCGVLSVLAAGVERPNVILIMADDMGYEALSSNGSESCKSPNLDKLAAKGVRFTNCFSNPICTPSRAKIMTGQYNVRNYVQFGLLDRGQTTFAHQLKAAGYATAIAGKWQLGKQKDAPQHFGFSLTRSPLPRMPLRLPQKYDRRFPAPPVSRNPESRLPATFP